MVDVNSTRPSNISQQHVNPHAAHGLRTPTCTLPRGWLMFISIKLHEETHPKTKSVATEM